MNKIEYVLVTTSCLFSHCFMTSVGWYKGSGFFFFLLNTDYSGMVAITLVPPHPVPSVSTKSFCVYCLLSHPQCFPFFCVCNVLVFPPLCLSKYGKPLITWDFHWAATLERANMEEREPASEMWRFTSLVCIFSWKTVKSVVQKRTMN